MVRSFRMGPPLLALAMATTLRAQSPQLQPASPSTVVPGQRLSVVPRGSEQLRTMPPSSTPNSTESLRSWPPPMAKAPTTPVPVVKAPGAPLQPGERLITVQELNRPAQVCRVLKSWRMVDGSQAYEVQATDTGEMMTILENGQLAAPPSSVAPGRPRLRAVATRIYHWGRSFQRPVGVPHELVVSTPPKPAPLPPGMPVAERLSPGETRYTPPTVVARPSTTPAGMPTADRSQPIPPWSPKPAPLPPGMPVAERLSPGETRYTPPTVRPPVVAHQGNPAEWMMPGKPMPSTGNEKSPAPVKWPVVREQIPGSPRPATSVASTGQPKVRNWPPAHAGQSASVPTTIPVWPQQTAPSTPPVTTPLRTSNSLAVPPDSIAKMPQGAPKLEKFSALAKPVYKPMLVMPRADEQPVPSPFPVVEQLTPRSEKPAGTCKPEDLHRPLLPRLFGRYKKPVCSEQETARSYGKPAEKVEPSKQFVVQPEVVAAPTAPPSASDWRKSWGKVAPKKLEVPAGTALESIASTQEKRGLPTIAKMASEPTPPITATPSGNKPLFHRVKPVTPTARTETAVTQNDRIPQPPSVPIPALPSQPEKEGKRWFQRDPKSVEGAPTVPPSASDWEVWSWGKVKPKKFEVPAGTAPESIASTQEKRGLPTIAKMASEPTPPITATPSGNKPLFHRVKPVTPTARTETAVTQNDRIPQPPSVPIPALPSQPEKEGKRWFQRDPKSVETAKVEEKITPLVESAPVTAVVKERKRWFPPEPKSVETAKRTESTGVESPSVTTRKKLSLGHDSKKEKGKVESTSTTPKREVPTSSASSWSDTSKRESVLPDAMPRARTTPESDPLTRPSDYVQKPTISESAKPKTEVARMATAQPLQRTSAKLPDAVAVQPPAPQVPLATSHASKTVLPPGSASVIASGDPRFIPVPIVTMPNPPVPPVVVPHAPQPNTHVYSGIAPGVPAPGMANAFTKPGPQRPVPAETIPPIDASNAFSDVVDGRGTPPPPVPALVSYSARSPVGPSYPQAVPPYSVPPGQMALGMQPQRQAHQVIVPPSPQLPAMPHSPVGPGAQSVPGVAWMQVQGRFVPANNLMAAQPYPVDMYGMPMGYQQPMMPAGYQQPMMPAGYQQPMMPAGYQQPMMPAGYQQPMMPAGYQQPMMQQASMQQQPSADTGLAGLLQMLRESDYPSQREWAADQLANSRWQTSPQVVTALLTAAREDPAPMVRASCVRALTRMQVNTLPVTSTLQQLQDDADPRVRDAVRDAMIALGIKVDAKK